MACEGEPRRIGINVYMLVCIWPRVGAMCAICVTQETQETRAGTVLILLFDDRGHDVSAACA